MNQLLVPDRIRVLGNRFAEVCPAASKDEGSPIYQMIEDALDVISDRCYPVAGYGVEQAHVVVMDSNAGGPNQTGILVEFELDDGVQPSEALKAAVTGLQALSGEGVHYMIYGGNTAEGVETFNDRWCVGAFIPLNTAMREGSGLVQRHADRLGPLLY